MVLIPRMSQIAQECISSNRVVRFDIDNRMPLPMCCQKQLCAGSVDYTMWRHLGIPLRLYYNLPQEIE